MIKVTINGASGKMGTKVSNLIKNDNKSTNNSGLFGLEKFIINA